MRSPKSRNALRKPELIHFFKIMLVYFRKTAKLVISIFILGLLFNSISPIYRKRSGQNTQDDWIEGEFKKDK